MIGEICAGDRWVLDTAYGAWLDVVLPRAELIVGLDYPRWFSLLRLVRRTLWRSITRERVCNVEPFWRMPGRIRSSAGTSGRSAGSR